MHTTYEDDLSEDSLDLIERLMEMEQEHSFEWPDEDCDADDWSQGWGVPRRGPFPVGSGSVEIRLPTGDDEGRPSSCHG